MNKPTITVILTAGITTIIILIGIALLMPILGPRYMHPLMMGNQPVPNNLDMSSEHLSDGGVFRLAWTSDPAEPPLNRMHTWTLHLETADGEPVEGADISVDGGMPQHGHGLPTRPRVTRTLGDGIYEIEGVRFNMGGWWEFRLAIAGSRGSDTVTFNLSL